MLILPFVSHSAKISADEEKELTDAIDGILDGIDFTQIQKYLDSIGDGFIEGLGASAKDIVKKLIYGNLELDYSSYLTQIFSTLFSGVKEMLPSFAQIVAISILCAIASDAEGGILSSHTAKVIRLACLSLVMVILSSMLLAIVGTAADSIQNIRRQVEIVTPILVTLTVLTGGSAAGAIYQPSAAFISGGAIELVSSIIFPCTVAVIVLNFLSKLNPDISFSGLSSLIKSVMKWLIGITVTVFGLFLTVQSASSSLFGGVFFKVTKYLVGNSVPIVGNFLSAGVDMIVMSGSVVKGSLGMLGIVLLIASVIKPITVLAAFSIILKLTGALMQPLGEKALYSTYADLSKDVEYLIAGVLMVAFMYCLIVMLIINSANSFI